MTQKETIYLVLSNTPRKNCVCGAFSDLSKACAFREPYNDRIEEVIVDGLAGAKRTRGFVAKIQIHSGDFAESPSMLLSSIVSYSSHISLPPKLYAKSVCYGFGSTKEEAVNNAKEAREEVIEKQTK